MSWTFSRFLAWVVTLGLVGGGFLLHAALDSLAHHNDGRAAAGLAGVGLLLIILCMPRAK